MFRFQSLDDDCTLEEEDDGLVEEEDEIDQFNDDTFGEGAIDDDWQEEHKRLAELDERDGHQGAGLGLDLGGGDAPPPPAEPRPPLPALGVSLPGQWRPPGGALNAPFADGEERAGGGALNAQTLNAPFADGGERAGGGALAEALARFILEADPAIAGVGAAEKPRPPQGQLPPPGASGPPPSSRLSYQQQQHILRRGAPPVGQMNSHSIWENSMGFGPVSVTPGLGTHMEVGKGGGGGGGGRGRGGGQGEGGGGLGTHMEA
ncbi:protein PAT1 homolog 1-like [Menidia menidia]